MLLPPVGFPRRLTMVTEVFGALSGLKNSIQELQNSANNLANVQTSEFKKSTVTVGNVDIADEMVGQMTTQTTFTTNAKVISSVDEIIGTILDIKS